MFKNLKVNDLLAKTGKTVSSLAAISLGLAIIAVSSVVIKDNMKELLSVKRIKAKVICIREKVHHKDPEEPVVEPKPVNKKPTSKSTTKNTSVKEEAAPAAK